MGKAKLHQECITFFTNSGAGKAKESKIAGGPEPLLRFLMEEHHFGKLVAHAPYTMNVCAAKLGISGVLMEYLKG